MREKNRTRVANIPDDPRDLTTKISDLERSAEDETMESMVADNEETPKTNKEVEFSLEEDRSKVLGRPKKRR